MDDRGRCETCAEMLEHWDAGYSVWSVEMGGLGPGYEQAIQVLAIECLRELVRADFQWTGEAMPDTERIKALLDPVAHRVGKWPGMGLSGAQVGAAMSIACMFHKQGPIGALEKLPKGDEDRKIQVSKTWPHEPVEAASDGE